MGSSRQLAVGPVAVTSLLIGSSMQSLLPCSSAITNANAPSGQDQVRMAAAWLHGRVHGRVSGTVGGHVPHAQIDCQNLYNTNVIQVK